MVMGIYDHGHRLGFCRGCVFRGVVIAVGVVTGGFLLPARRLVWIAIHCDEDLFYFY